jgi:hypothetical protein
MKEEYSRPSLLVFGRIGHLTLGSGGPKPDINNQLNNVGNGCTAPDPKAIGCFVGSDP